MNAALSQFGFQHPACSMRALAEHEGIATHSARGLIAWIAEANIRRVVLDAIHPELRPRGLSRSARRDLAATLKRTGLDFSGIDIFIPPVHLADPTHADRATSAIVGAIELARDLESLGCGGQSIVCMALPDELPDDVREAIVCSAEACAVSLASVRGLAEGVSRAIDLEALSDADVDIPRAIAGADAVQVRWGGPRPGRRMDLMAIRAAMTVQQPAPTLVLDLSRSTEPGIALRGAIRAWEDADPIGGMG